MSSTGTSSGSTAVATNHRCPNGSRITPDRAPYCTLTGRNISAPSASASRNVRSESGTWIIKATVLPPRVSGPRCSSSGYSSASMNTVSPTRSSAWPTWPSGMITGSPSKRASNTRWYHSMARSAPLHARYGVREWSRAGVYSRISLCSVGAASMPSATASRSRSWLTNCGRGAIGAIGSRNDSNASGIVAPPFGVFGAEGVAGAHQQRLGRVHRPPEQVGHLGDGQAVQVTQCERGAVVCAEPVEHLPRPLAIEALLHVLLERLRWLDEVQRALLALQPAPMVDELVARHGDQPRHGEVGDRVTLHRLRGGEEGLRRKVFGDDGVPRPSRKVAVHLR